MSEQAGIRILIFGKTSNYLNNVKKVFKENGFLITMVETPTEAIDLPVNENFTLAICALSGLFQENIKVLNAVRKLEKDGGLPVIFIAGPGIFENPEIPDSSDNVDYFPEGANPIFLLHKVNLFARHNDLTNKLKIRKQILQQQNEELQKQKQILSTLSQKIKGQTLYDKLTKLPNRRFFKELVDIEWRRSIRTSHPVSTIAMEIDFFEEYKAQYGDHETQNMIKRLTEILTDTTKRAADFIARYSEDEFVVILPETGMEPTIFLAESIRENIELLHIPHAKSNIGDYVTISAGIMHCIPSFDSTPEVFIENTFNCLDAAKENGGNQINHSE